MRSVSTSSLSIIFCILYLLYRLFKSFFKDMNTTYINLMSCCMVFTYITNWLTQIEGLPFAGLTIAAEKQVIERCYMSLKHYCTLIISVLRKTSIMAPQHHGYSKLITESNRKIMKERKLSEALGQIYSLIHYYKFLKNIAG